MQISLTNVKILEVGKFELYFRQSRARLKIINMPT
jgi:hypothetical protein